MISLVNHTIIQVLIHITKSQNRLPFQSVQGFCGGSSVQAFEIISSFREMGLQEDFEEYAEKAKSLPPTTKDAVKLILYGLYKQVMIGDVNTTRPGIFSPKEKAKWDAWKAVEGKTKDEAMTDYIAKVKQLQEAASA